MRRTLVVVVALLLPAFPLAAFRLAAQDAAPAVDARIVLPRGALLELRFAEPRPLALLDARGRPARRTDLRGDLGPVRAVRATARMREARADTLLLELSRVDTLGGRHPMYPRRGVLAHVVADSFVTLEVREPSRPGRWAGPVALGVLMGVLATLAAVGAIAGDGFVE